MSNNIHTKVSRTLQQLLKQRLINNYELIPTDTHLLKIKLEQSTSKYFIE
jgi:predicted neutral ceramidase superfamily lipid hydrolase